MPPLHPAAPHDAPRIAALHARSWQENYTAAMSATYLQQEAPAERLAVWTERFAHPAPGMRVLLAEDDDGELLGFSCLFLDHHSEDGSLLDNLHVRADQQGTGLGKRLMQATARLVLAEAQNDKLYLWVLDSNTRARAVYERLGGRVGRSEQHHMPGTGPEGVAATSMHWRAGELLE
ncbi:GNAT family N-acetyltransferase [Neolewinella sp.]|uniref:GNAT family N-acetyltransferase n=1 Tax=Neolewinella sp. TaxID=2993543 RepID=UPI003B52E1A6